MRLTFGAGMVFVTKACVVATSVTADLRISTFFVTRIIIAARLLPTSRICSSSYKILTNIKYFINCGYSEDSLYFSGRWLSFILAIVMDNILKPYWHWLKNYFLEGVDLKKSEKKEKTSIIIFYIYIYIFHQLQPDVYIYNRA